MDMTENTCDESLNKVYVEPSSLEKLRNRRAALMERLSEVDRAIRALESYPELSGMVDLVKKACR